MSVYTQTKSRNSFSTLLESRLIKNIGWMTGAEMVSRLGRIVTAIILARTLDMVTFGVAAMALTIFELMRIFTENGIGAAVIRVPENKLAATTNSAYRMMWFVCGSLAIVQTSIGMGTLYLYPETSIGWMICALASVYLVMPFGLIHAYILLRQERLKRLAVISSAQTFSDHMLTAALALSGFGAWAIVLPKILTTPIWLIGVMHGKPWARDRAAGFYPARNILQFSMPILFSEFAVAAREHLDKVLISTLLGLEALGLYYFAFNAGLGLSTALNRALNAALYPFLCADKTSQTRNRFRQTLWMAGTPLAAIYCAQAVGAFIYVPFLFGTEWAHAAPFVAILCLAGPARMLLDSIRMYWRANGKTLHELKLSLFFTAGTLIPILIFANSGLMITAAALVASSSLTSIGIALPVLTDIRFKKHSPSKKESPNDLSS